MPSFNIAIPSSRKSYWINYSYTVSLCISFARVHSSSFHSIHLVIMSIMAVSQLLNCLKRVSVTQLLFVLGFTLFYSLPVAACSSDNGSTAISTVQYLPSRPDIMARDGSEIELCSVNFLSAVSPSKSVLILGGSVSCPELGSRSLLLYSKDGGKKWQETTPQFFGSTLHSLHFVTSNDGFGLASWSQEGPGEEIMLTTNDAGKTWLSLTKLPKGAEPHLSTVDSFRFISRSRGFFVLSNYGGSRVLFETSDGGMSWNKSRTTAESALESVDSEVLVSRDTTQDIWSICEVRNGSNPRPLSVIPSKVPASRVAAMK